MDEFLSLSSNQNAFFDSPGGVLVEYRCYNISFLKVCFSHFDANWLIIRESQDKKGSPSILIQCMASNRVRYWAKWFLELSFQVRRR